MKWMIPLPLLLMVACQVPTSASTAKQEAEVATTTAGPSKRQVTEDPAIIVVYVLKHAHAGSMESVLQNLLPNRRGTQFRVVADHRLNAILLSGAKDQVEQAKALLVQLDVPSPKDE